MARNEGTLFVSLTLAVVGLLIIGGTIAQSNVWRVVSGKAWLYIGVYCLAAIIIMRYRPQAHVEQLSHDVVASTLTKELIRSMKRNITYLVLLLGLIPIGVPLGWFDNWRDISGQVTVAVALWIVASVGDVLSGKYLDRNG